MPTYEMPLLIRTMSQSGYKQVLKRVAENIFNTGGFIRKIENWGVKELPCKASNHGSVHQEAAHFMISFDVPPSYLRSLTDQCNRDVDVVRSRIYKQTPPEPVECTFHEEMLPPPYREDVQKILKAGKRQEKKKKFVNTGMIYPFQK